MKMTLTPPKGAGYFWWTNGGEHTPTILYVKKDRDGNLYADDGHEYCFMIDREPIIGERMDPEEEHVFVHEGVGYFYGTRLWSAQAIELPEIGGEFVLPDSF